MSGNPYFKTAVQRHAMVTANKTQPAELVMALAACLQGEATLALAYEQRTANLIALVAIGVTDMTGWPAKFVEVHIKRNEIIHARLGLNEGATK